jgi:hypothetical protein
MRHRTLTFPALALLLATTAHAQTEYYRHSVFDNSLERDFYYYSFAQAAAPSSLAGKNSRLPVDSEHFLSPPNALRIHWQSMPGGGWDAEVHLDNFRNRSPGLSGRTLYFWVYSPTAIAAADLPKLMLSQAREGLQVATFPSSFTAPEPLGRFIGGDLPANKWVEVRVPMGALGATLPGALRGDPKRWWREGQDPDAGVGIEAGDEMAAALSALMDHFFGHEPAPTEGRG